MIPYTPKRDYRFEYVSDVATFIETHQCGSCALKSDSDEFPMCSEVSEKLFAEAGPVAALDDRGFDGVVCVKYRNEELAVQEHPDQGRLI